MCCNIKWHQEIGHLHWLNVHTPKSASIFEVELKLILILSASTIWKWHCCNLSVQRDDDQRVNVNVKELLCYALSPSKLGGKNSFGGNEGESYRKKGHEWRGGLVLSASGLAALRTSRGKDNSISTRHNWAQLKINMRFWPVSHTSAPDLRS